jgi:hypothetical protein
LEAFTQKWNAKDKRDVTTVKDAFQDYVHHLRGNDQIGTAINYECAMNKIEGYAPGLLLKEVTKDWLERFEKDMKRAFLKRSSPSFLLPLSAITYAT